MPLNTLRLNHQKSTHPNDRIVFIKPLPRPSSDRTSYDLADTFLRAIAAQCLPIMKNHFLSITTLEEHEPNREFIGRNFNNGEVIQLVLRSSRGGWLPFNMVQMVMMHELAHNTHMNHGRDFWKTRNLYVEELKSLWQRGYTGEGLWGSGRALSDLAGVGVMDGGNNGLASEELARLPLCGGTFRSRRKTRKRKRGKGDEEQLTWKEKRDRRIERKFGKNGVALGEDESKRLALDYNHAKTKTKTTKGVAKGVSLGLTRPRVAQSKRGRELRAAAALARFETNKKEAEVLEQQNTEKDEDEEDEDEEEEGDEDGDDLKEDAVDLNGSKLLDRQGKGMVRVCEREDAGHDNDAQHELEEMNSLDRYFKPVVQRQQQQQQEQKHPASDRSIGYDDDYAKGKNGLRPEDAVGRTTPRDSGETINGQDSFGMDTNTSVQPTISVTTTPEDASSGLGLDNRTTPRVVSPGSSTSTSRRTRTVTGTESLDTPGPKPETQRTVPKQEGEAEQTTQTQSAPAPATVSPSPTIPTATTTGISSACPTSTSSVLCSSSTTTISCPICSLDNPRLNAICIACSHVLDPQKDPRHWVCQSESCRNTLYRNPGDAGLCGICGERRR
ncbi:hypothetical protein ABEF95_000951 [Exophiala dermatitidis]